MEDVRLASWAMGMDALDGLTVVSPDSMHFEALTQDAVQVVQEKGEIKYILVEPEAAESALHTEIALRKKGELGNGDSLSIVVEEVGAEAQAYADMAVIYEKRRLRAAKTGAFGARQRRLQRKIEQYKERAVKARFVVSLWM